MTNVPDLPATEGTATLVGYGRVSWPEVTQLLTGSQAAWADYTGFHVGPPATVTPSVLPPLGLDDRLASANPSRRRHRHRRHPGPNRPPDQPAPRAMA